mmetsp:Transcript_7182/g.25641  ORF Transcript_7182/g.25641 Transcript_7182/m.25641 type:complete len:335 (+) Transcript_7182:789-1793(+)
MSWRGRSLRRRRRSRPTALRLPTYVLLRRTDSHARQPPALGRLAALERKVVVRRHLLPDEARVEDAELRDHGGRAREDDRDDEREDDEDLWRQRRLGAQVGRRLDGAAHGAGQVVDKVSSAERDEVDEDDDADRRLQRRHDKRRRQQRHELAVVALPDAVVQPLAVVVKDVDALVADAAVPAPRLDDMRTAVAEHQIQLGIVLVDVRVVRLLTKLDVRRVVRRAVVRELADGHDRQRIRHDDDDAREESQIAERQRISRSHEHNEQHPRRLLKRVVRPAPSILPAPFLRHVTAAVEAVVHGDGGSKRRLPRRSRRRHARAYGPPCPRSSTLLVA